MQLGQRIETSTQVPVFTDLKYLSKLLRLDFCIESICFGHSKIGGMTDVKMKRNTCNRIEIFIKNDHLQAKKLLDCDLDTLRLSQAKNETLEFNTTCNKHKRWYSLV